MDIGIFAGWRGFSRRVVDRHDLIVLACSTSVGASILLPIFPENRVHAAGKQSRLRLELAVIAKEVGREEVLCICHAL